jgi:hypothetical protein
LLTESAEFASFQSKGVLVNIKLKSISLLASLGLAITAATPLSAQTKTRTTVPAKQISRAAVNDPAALLPASDAILTVDVKRVLNDALPLFFADDPAGMANVNAEIQKFKTETGLDPRSFERVAVGMNFQSPRQGVTTSDTVAIARGTFQAGAIVAAGKIASTGKYEEQKFGASTIYIFNLKENVKMLGLVNTRVSQLAVVVIDKNTLALGDLNMVKAALDSKKGIQPNAELIALASRSPEAFLGFGANVPANIADGINFPSDQISQNVRSIRQVYGSVTAAGTQLDMFASAKTNNPEEAASLNDTLGGLKQLGAMVVSQLKVDQRKLAQNALDNLRIDVAGNEVQLKLSIQQADLATLMRTVGKKKA